MNWETINGVFTLSFDPLFTTAIAAILYMIGVGLRRKIAFLTRYSIPAAVISGLKF